MARARSSYLRQPFTCILAVVTLMASPVVGKSIEAGEEGQKNGIDHYQFEVAENPRIDVFDAHGQTICTLVVSFGQSPGEQKIAMETSLGESLLLHWQPSEGLFTVTNGKTGSRGAKILTPEGWQVKVDEDLTFEKFEQEISIAAAATAEYMLHIGQGSR